MTIRTFIACLIVAAIGLAAVRHVIAHPAALPLSAPWGSYDTRAHAFDAARDVLDRGQCAKLEAVNDQQTELQPC